jgi:hypothetical protein
MQQQKSIALHSTGSEIIGNFAATKEALKSRDTAQFIQQPPKYYYKPFPIYMDSQPAIDSIVSNTITSRVKHIAVHIGFMNEQVNRTSQNRHKAQHRRLRDQADSSSHILLTFRLCDWRLILSSQRLRALQAPRTSQVLTLSALHKIKYSSSTQILQKTTVRVVKIIFSVDADAISAANLDKQKYLRIIPCNQIYVCDYFDGFCRSNCYLSIPKSTSQN